MNRKHFPKRLTRLSVLLLLTLASATSAQKLYWGERPNPGIFKANLDGTDIEHIGISGTDDDVTVMSIDRVAGKLYLVDQGFDAAIFRSNLDGTHVEPLLTDLTGVDGIALDVEGGKMYWTSGLDDSIRRANLDGSDPELLENIGVGLRGIALDVQAGKMYWGDQGSDLDKSSSSSTGNDAKIEKGVGIRKILRANLDGSNIETVVTLATDFNPGIPLDVELDIQSGKIYWTRRVNSQPFDSSIQRANLDGTNVEDLVTADIYTPRYLELDLENGKMYWTDKDGLTAPIFDRIVRANLDGSEKEDVITDLEFSPRGLAIGPAITPSAVENWNLYE